MAAHKLSGISFLLLALSVLPQAAQGTSQTTLTLAVSPNPSSLGVPVTLTATVAPSNATGHVTFYDGVTVLGTRQLAGGLRVVSDSPAALRYPQIASLLRRRLRQCRGDIQHGYADR
jgi:hypothetical protein